MVQCMTVARLCEDNNNTCSRPLKPGLAMTSAAVLIVATAVATPLGAVLVDSDRSAKPSFSWDTLPLFYHCSNATGPYTEAALRVMARASIVTVWPVGMQVAKCTRLRMARTTIAVHVHVRFQLACNCHNLKHFLL